jgi:electron-transferring-flavoprotein dehydrogenase
MTNAREKIDFDVLFVGGGPANLAGAIRLMQLAEEKGLQVEVALIEKGGEVGSHALSGAILNPVALKELFPNYDADGCPIETDVRGDALCFLTEGSHHELPFVPRYMRNKGFHIVSLSRFVRWLATKAEALGVNIFPGFAGQEVLYDENDNTVIGVRTGDKGLDRRGEPKANFEPGIDIMAKVTSFGEGAKGSLLRELDKTCQIFDSQISQTFETGIKEVIQLPDVNFFSDSPINDIHTIGYPLGLNTHSGGFVYEMKDNKVALGLVIGLAYDDPMVDPYAAFIRFKKHPFIHRIIQGGRVIEQGARVLGNGGYYTIPRLAVGGGVIVGAGASMLNAPALKGIHTAMKSGMLAAEAIVEALRKGDFSRQTLSLYHDLFESSWLRAETYAGRNFAQALSKKMPAKLFHLGAQYLTGGRGLIDKMPVRKDWQTLRPLKDRNDEVSPSLGETGPKPAYDNILFVDKLMGVYLSKTQHREDEPCHLIVHDTLLCVTECFDHYGCPCTRFCPGNVYEIEIDETSREKKLKLNPSNCLHCKTCEIKDPYENITWTCPEGGEGPKYTVT